MTLIHGTGLFFHGKGILLTGRSGAGKSDFALRLMGRGAELVGDDYLEIGLSEENRVIMHAPDRIAGKIEIHNVGIMDTSYRESSEVDLVLNLKKKNEIDQMERLPDLRKILLEGQEIPSLDFYAFEASAPQKLQAALKIFF